MNLRKESIFEKKCTSESCRAVRLTGKMKATECLLTNASTSTPVLLPPSAEPDGPPMEVILQPVTSQSIRVTWKVKC